MGRLKTAALDRFGQVDILVNNTGVGNMACSAARTAADYDWMMNTNMRSSSCTSAFLPRYAGEEMRMDRLWPPLPA